MMSVQENEHNLKQLALIQTYTASANSDECIYTFFA